MRPRVSSQECGKTHVQSAPRAQRAHDECEADPHAIACLAMTQRNAAGPAKRFFDEGAPSVDHACPATDHRCHPCFGLFRIKNPIIASFATLAATNSTPCPHQLWYMVSVFPGIPSVLVGIFSPMCEIIIFHVQIIFSFLLWHFLRSWGLTSFRHQTSSEAHWHDSHASPSDARRALRQRYL